MNSKEVAVVSAKQSTISSNQKQRPTNEEIAARAYEMFLLNGASHGSDMRDWLQAEQELLERKQNRPQVRTATDW
jgi:Protein of unknown function (DUF2934)